MSRRCVSSDVIRSAATLATSTHRPGSPLGTSKPPASSRSWAVADFPKDALAAGMAAYHGGWVECALRRWEVPVRVYDVRSTYATIASHLNIQAYLAGPVDVLDGDEARDGAQQLLNT